MRALACYAFTGMFIVLFWPGGSVTRYFFPVVLPLCVLGGLAYDALATRWPAVVAPALAVTLGILERTSSAHQRGPGPRGDAGAVAT